VLIKADAAATAETESTESVTVAGYGGFSGSVVYEGAIPPPVILLTAGDPKVKPEERAVCAPDVMYDESLMIDGETMGVSNVLVFLDRKPAVIKPELVAPPETPAIFDQKNCRFIPHLFTVRVGQPVWVLSDDPIAHNTHTYPGRNSPLNTGIKPNAREADAVRYTYTRPENSPFTVTCDFHSWMKAYHYTVDHPYFAVTDEKGTFRIEGLPAGEHEFNLWHERAAGNGQFLERRVRIVIEPDVNATREFKMSADKFRS
jgi:plastocyanin